MHYRSKKSARPHSRPPSPPSTPRERPVVGPGYKRVALSNTTLDALMATINSSIILIALPAIFTLGSVLLFLTPGSGNTAALELIIFRLVQSIGAGFLFANSTAILTDAFPPNERGMAMAIVVSVVVVLNVEWQR